jgi:DNA-binding transcriptional MerR regulator
MGANQQSIQRSSSGRRRIGTVAKEARVSVRTLRYYDDIGLLSPSCRTASGHRLYDAERTRRLHLISALRRLGLSLKDVRRTLDSGGSEALKSVEGQIVRLRSEIAKQQQLCTRAEMVAMALRSQQTPTTSELLTFFRKITLLERYLSHEQLEDIKRRREALGKTEIFKLQKRLRRLIDRFRFAMDERVPPNAERLQSYRERWLELLKRTVGEDDHVLKSLRTMYERETDLATELGLNPQLLRYISAAMSSRPTQICRH